jgi:uncharacterized membrane protein
MAKNRGAFKATLVRGILFLLPLILVCWLLSKALKVIEKLSQPVVTAAGVNSGAAIVVGTIFSVGVLVITALAAGLIARTRLGQAAFSGLENSVLSLLPQWRMARGLIESFDPEKLPEVEVVLVPTDAGWCVGFVLEKTLGDWWTVFIPGAPQWTSGGVSYASVNQVRRTNLSFAEAIMILRRCGTGSDKIVALLASLQQKDLA